MGNVMLKILTPVMSGNYFTRSYKHAVNLKSSRNPYAKKEYKTAGYANTEYILYSRLIFGKIINTIWQTPLSLEFFKKLTCYVFYNVYRKGVF